MYDTGSVGNHLLSISCEILLQHLFKVSLSIITVSKVLLDKRGPEKYID